MGTKNRSRRMPIIFCLDVSPSMGFRGEGNISSIELLNTAVENFITQLNLNANARTAAEIAFVTFSTDIIMDTDFISITKIEAPHLSVVDKGGTQMAKAVLHSIDKIETRRNELVDAEIPFFAPFLVIVTDGNPDDNDNKDEQKRALEMVRAHCRSHVGASEIIIPFVIGVGDKAQESKVLEDYSGGFIDGYFPIKGDASKASDINKVFEFIGNSTIRSIDLNNLHKTVITIQRTMEELREDLKKEKALKNKLASET